MGISAYIGRGTLPSSPAGQTVTAPPASATGDAIAAALAAGGRVITPVADGVGAARVPTISPAPAASAFPDATNTGYPNAPGYPGSLTAGPGTIASNTTYSYKEFNGCDVGLTGSPVTNVTFYGCRFHSNWVTGWNVAVAGDNILFDYCTFEPDVPSSGTVDYNDGYQYGIKQNTTLPNKNFTVDHCNFYGFGNACEFAYSTQAKPVIFRNNYVHHARTDGGGVDHTDGPQSNNANVSYVVIDHNTIVSEGNTQGIALQSEASDPGYDHITITNNYLSGWGYTVAIGENETGDTNITFTDNVFGTDIAPDNGFIYDDDTWTTGNTHLWRRNTLNVKPYPSQSTWNYPTPSNHGKFMYPNETFSTTDYAL